MIDWIKVGIEKHYIELLDSDGVIHYILPNKKFKFSDPEEQVRASLYVELIEKYVYEERKIDLEVVVPRRTPNDFADIVIFKDDDKKEPYIVIECKRDGISEAEFNQAIEQCFGNSHSLASHYALIAAGNTRRSYEVKDHKPLERIENIIADIPVKYGKVQEWRFRKSDLVWDIQIVGKIDLINVLEKCHDTLWQGGKLAPTVAFDELCKIIFVKIRDEKRPKKKGEPYDFQIKTHEKPDSVKARIDQIYKEAMNKDPEVFTEEIKVDARRLFIVVNHLQGINLGGTDLDVKGVAFERFMEEFFKGKIGQYFTPREIVDFMVKMIKPDREDLVLDPACGSGGFLLHALDYIRIKADHYYPKETVDHYNYWHEFAEKRLYGIEINDSISRVAKMNMILHDDGHTNVIGADGLKEIELLELQNSSMKKEKFDIILTNPPFGANVKKEEAPYLERYFLGSGKKSQKTEILFIERCFEFLKENGLLAIVLPNGILSNTTIDYVRNYILDNFRVLAVIGLPATAFTHYGAGVESSLLFLKKYPKETFNLLHAKRISIKAEYEEILKAQLNILKKEYQTKIKVGSQAQIEVTNEYKPLFKVILESIEDCLCKIGQRPLKEFNEASERFLRKEISVEKISMVSREDKKAAKIKLKEFREEMKKLYAEYSDEFNSALDETWLKELEAEYKENSENVKLIYSEKTEEDFKKWIKDICDYPIFYARPEKIGYDATGRKCDNHLPNILSLYNEFFNALEKGELEKISIGEYGEIQGRQDVFVIWRSQLEYRLDPYCYCCPQMSRDRRRMLSKS